MQKRFRPNSVKFRSIKKPRVLNGLNQTYMKPFDPWCSMYKENFCNIDKLKKNKKTNLKKKTNKNDFDDILSVKSLKPSLNYSNSIKKGFSIKKKNQNYLNKQRSLIQGQNRKNLRNVKNNNFTNSKLKKQVSFKKTKNSKNYAKRLTNELERINFKKNKNSKNFQNINDNNYNTLEETNDIFNDQKPNQLINYMEKYQDENIHNEANKNTNKISNMNNNESNLQKSIKIVNNLSPQHLRNTHLEQTNSYGQKETWLDPVDAIQNPVNSRVVTDPKGSDFIIKNLQTLLAQKNEYFPHIGGKCLCGDCICGTCRCVHFKYKPLKIPNDNLKTIYQQDFVKFDINRPKPLKAPAELHLFPFKKNYTTQYGTHFKKPIPLKDDFNLINKAKLDNIEPFKGLKAPCNKHTRYKLDFPDWGICPTESIKPFNPKSLIKIPFYGKGTNGDYGDFYNKNQVPKIVKPVNNEKNRNPLGPNIPINYETCHKKDFVKFPNDLLDSIEKKIPKDNLFLNKEKFKNQYRSVQRDFDGKQRGIICPVKLEVKRVKNIIRNYARSKRIPYN